MKKIFFCLGLLLPLHFSLQAQTKTSSQKVRYDTIIVKHVDKKAKKPAPKTAIKTEVVLPTPEFVNQPYYFDKDGNRLIALEHQTATLVKKKKALGLKGSKQSLQLTAATAKVRFTAKKEIVFFIRTGGDVIDVTSFMKLYRFAPADERREVTVNTKEGMLNDNEDQKGKQISLSLKMITKDTYRIELPEQLEAGEYGFVWMKNLDLSEFTVFAFGIDWKSSD